LVKIAPDLSDNELEDIADTALNSGVDGIIVSNTTISRPDTLQSGLLKDAIIPFCKASNLSYFN
jgi:dihydroorotate dehydrogenase